MANELDVIRVETALSRYPMHRLSKLGTIAIDLKKTTGDGEMTLRWEASHNSKFGQPGPLAYKIDTLVVNRKIEQAGRPIPRIIRLGSLAEIAEATGTGDNNTAAIKRALHQNASAYITAKMTYRTKGGGKRTTEIGDTRYAVVFKDETLPNGLKADAVYIVLHDFYREILDNALTRPLDYEYIRGLAPVAQRWYELASFQVFAAVRYGKPATLSYADFCMHAPQTRYFVGGEVRKQMAKVHEPHVRAGYITGVEFQETMDRQGKPDWVMTYTPGPKATAEHQSPKRAVLAIEAEPEPTGLEAELVTRGVTRGVAAELVRDYPEDRIRGKVDQVDWLRAKNPKKIADVGAYLAEAIRKNYSAPAGFESGADRARREEDQRAQRRREAEDRQRQNAQKARERAEQARVDAYWSGLSPEQQARLDADALARADPETKAGCESGLPPVRRLCIKLTREAYIRTLLGRKATS